MEKAMLQQTLVFQFFIIFLGVAWVAFKVRFRLNSTLRDTKNSISSQGSQNRENPKPSQKSGRPGKQIITDVKQIITDVKQKITGVKQIITYVKQKITDVKQIITDVKQIITDVKQIITGVKQIITYVNLPAFSESCVLPLLYSSPPHSFAPAAKSRLYNLKPSLTAA